MNATTTPQRALILIDVQNEYVTGNLRIEYPPVQSSLARIGEAVAAATAAGIPIVTVQQMAPHDSPVFAEGSIGWQLHPVAADIRAAHHVRKQLPSALAGTDLGPWLRDRGIDTLVVAGYMSQNCNESTIRQAAHEGFQVEYLHDAAGAVSYRNAQGLLRAEDMHRASLVVLQSRFAAVLSTADWLALLEQGGAAPRENLYQSYLAAQT